MADNTVAPNTYTYRTMKKKFPLKDQKVIGKLVLERKRKFEADKKKPEINKSVWNEKRKKWVSPFAKTGFIQPSVRVIFPDLAKDKCDAADFKSATKFLSRCMEKYERRDLDAEENDSSKKFRLPGAGARSRAVEVREALFDYFIDIRMSLKGRLPMFMLQAKAIELYERYSELKREAGETPEQLTINKSWVRRWATEKHISLRCPNKRFSISQDARKRRIIQFLMNMWEVRRFWLQA